MQAIKLGANSGVSEQRDDEKILIDELSTKPKSPSNSNNNVYRSKIKTHKSSSKNKLKSSLIKKQIDENNNNKLNTNSYHSSSTSSLSTSTSPSFSSSSSSSSSSSTSSSSGHSSPSQSPQPQNMDRQSKSNKSNEQPEEEEIIDDKNDTLLNNYSKLLDLSRAAAFSSNNNKLIASIQEHLLQQQQNQQQHLQQQHQQPKLNLLMNVINKSINTQPVSIQPKKYNNENESLLHNHNHQVQPTQTSNTKTYIPPTPPTSSEVKLKLKNAILQKLDRNKNNLNNGNNLTSISMYQLPSSNKNHQLLTNQINHQSQLADLSNNNNISTNQQKLPLHFHSNNNQNHHGQAEMNTHHILNMNNSNTNNNNTNLLLSLNQDLDENNLRRTTSEPNLKVKSALKDRLLEKRNLLINPFPTNNGNSSVTGGGGAVKRPLPNTMMNKQINMTNKPTPVIIQPALNQTITNNNTHLNHNHAISSSLSSLPSFTPNNFLTALSSSQQQQQENPLFAAAAAAAAAATMAAMSKQQHQNNPGLNYNQLTQTLHQLALQQQKLNHPSKQTNMELFEQLALAAALANQQQLNVENINKRPIQNNNYDYVRHLHNQNLHQHHHHPYLMNNNHYHHLLPQSSNHQFQHHQTMLPPPQLQPHSSLSFPNLPIQNQLFNHHLLSNKNENESSLSSSSDNKNNNLDTSNKPPTLLKFGHIVHVEEENEAMLEDELKNAAKINEIATKNLLSNNITPTTTPPINNNIQIDEEEEDVEEDLHQNNTKRYKSNDYNNNNNNRLERASSHQFYSSPCSSSNKQHKLFHNNNTSIPHFNNSQQFALNLTEAQQQLLYLQQQQQEIENEKRLQEKYQNSKLSFLSDPHLLRSLKIASMANLNPSQISPSSSSSNDSSPSLKKSNNNKLTNSHQITPMECNAVSSEDRERVYRYTTGIAYDKIMLKHECTCKNLSNHLETPDRIKSIWSRFKSKDLDEECEIINSKLATISDLLLCHNEKYALIFGSDLEMRPKLPKEYLQTYMMSVCMASCNGFSLTDDQDNSWNEEYTPLACRSAVGTTYELANLVYNGKLRNGFALVRPPGSHAEYNKPLGFCYFNTVAIVAKMLKKNLGLERILIVDWDVHHGNGTQQMLYNDSNILYISLHRHDNGNFFPGTGSIYECGQEAGLGKNVNIAWNGRLNPPMGDTEYLAAFRSVVMPIAKSFKPQIVLVSCGFDGTDNHPKELGGYKLSPMCMLNFVFEDHIQIKLYLIVIEYDFYNNFFHNNNFL